MYKTLTNGNSKMEELGQTCTANCIRKFTPDYKDNKQNSQRIRRSNDEEKASKQQLPKPNKMLPKGGNLI